MIGRLILASYRRRFRQLALIVAAVTVAAATVAALAGFALRAESGLRSELARFGPNLTVRPQVAGPEGLAAESVERIRRMPGVEGAAGVVERARSARALGGAAPAVVLVEEGEGELQLVAADRELLALHPAWRLEGRWPEPGEALLGSAVTVGTGEATPSAAARGRAVVGTLETGGSLDRAVLVPLSDPDASFPLVDRAEVRVAGERLEAVRKAIEQTVPGVEASPLLRVSASETSVVRRLVLLLAVLSVVTCALALISVGAATVALVEERRTEVGLLVALGFSGRRVTLIFAAELLGAALLAALAGNLIGELAAAEMAGRFLSGVAPVAASWASLVAAAFAAVVMVGSSMHLALKRVEGIDAARVLKGE